MRSTLLAALIASVLSTTALAGPPTIPVSIKADANVTAKKQVVVSGTTNLPDETHFIVSINNDARQFHASNEVVVKSGSFRTAPLGPDSGMLPGQYEIEVMAPVPDVQPKAVRAVIGENGERLKGSLVHQSDWGAPYIEYKVRFQVGDLREGEKLDAQHRAKISAIYSETKGLLEKGVQMENVRTGTRMEDARQCGILMRQYQPQAKALRDRAMETEVYPLRLATIESISCVSCASSAKEACQRGLKALREYKGAPNNRL